MEDVWSYFLGIVIGLIFNLALLAQVWHLANIVLLADFHNQFDCASSCNLLDMHYIWLQCMDLPQFIRRSRIC